MCAVALAVLTFAAMQVFRDELGTEGKMSILGGFIGSWFFVFVLTATGNFFSLLFGQSYQTKLFPEAFCCILAAMAVSALVHRVSATTCLLFSLVALYFLNRISHSVYDSSAPPKVVMSSRGALGKSPSGKGKVKHG